MRWFRLWSELIDDPKICKMDEKTFRIFILLMCLAAEREQNGIIDLSEKDVAWRLRISQNILTRARQKLESLSILGSNNGNMVFLNWEKRQFRSDCSTERVKRFRNVTRNNIETPPETETETETEKKIEVLRTSARSRNGDGSKPHLDITFDGQCFSGITEEHKQKWQAAFPAVDITNHILRAEQWLIANPVKRKKNHYRFLTNWFSRQQERGGGKPSNKTACDEIDDAVAYLESKGYK